MKKEDNFQCSPHPCWHVMSHHVFNLWIYVEKVFHHNLNVIYEYFFFFVAPAIGKPATTSSSHLNVFKFFLLPLLSRFLLWNLCEKESVSYTGKKFEYFKTNIRREERFRNKDIYTHSKKHEKILSSRTPKAFILKF